MFNLDRFLQSSVHYVSSGLFVSDGEWVHPARTIEGYELIFVIRGAVLIAEEETEYILNPGDALFLRPGVEHHGSAPSREDISFYWVHFDFEPPEPEISNSAHIEIAQSSNLHILLRQLLHYANTPRYPAACCDDLLRLVVAEVLLAQSEAGRSGNALIHRVQQWIRIHYDKAITLEEIESRFNYNRDYLSRLFKKNFNIGIKQYIDEVKMNKAKEFIVSGAPLSSLPDMLGIESYNLFLKKFKYHEGVSPKQFRDAYSNLHLNKK